MQVSGQAGHKEVKDFISKRRLARIQSDGIRLGSTVMYGQGARNARKVLDITPDGFLVVEGSSKPVSPLLVWGVE